ncbi:hypothetical protein [Tateyamaria sp.]|uniref:hypothetical protein n=1 Tax=Tateyamaria sp. TaxID=1929288 RepID=UPI00329E511F
MPERKWSRVVVTDVTDKTTKRKPEDWLRHIIEVEEPDIFEGIGRSGRKLTAEEQASELKRLFLWSQRVDELRTETETARRSAGGKARVAAQKPDGDLFWRPWRDRYQGLVEGGKKRGAIGIIENEMIKHQAKRPGSNRVPSRATIRRQLTGRN